MSSIHQIRAAARIRVAHITHGLDVGGLEKLLVEFARHTNRERFQLHFVSLGGRGRLADDIEALGCTVTALEQPTGLRPQIIVRLAKLFRQQRIDVVHTHDNRPLIYGAPAARLAGIRCVIHTKHYGQLATVTRRQNALTSFASRFCNDFVCVSRHSAELSRDAGVPAAKIRTIWNGIDLRRFPYRGPNPHGPIVTVARLSPEKGLDTLLQAAALVVTACPELRFEIAGHGPCLAALQQSAAALGLEKHVQFLGDVRDVPALLARARLFVLPSLAEGISLTLLEAMATGLPVVASRVGGNPEVVEDGDSGVLAPPQDPTALAEAILRLGRSAPEGSRLGLAGRRRVEAHFDVGAMVRDYAALYRRGLRLPSCSARESATVCGAPSQRV